MSLFAAATAQTPARVLIIAELGVNHDGQIGRALELLRVAADAGADAVKVQWFDPDRLLSNQAVLADYQKAAADEVRQMLAGLTLNLDEMKRLRDAARTAGMAFVATPFSPADVPELANLNLDAVKIASPDAVNPPLLAAAAELGLPMLVSTGTCDLAELEPAAALLARHDAGGALLQCVSSYPVPAEAAAVGAIPVLAERFGLPVGYSDHTADTLTGAVAVAAGAVVLEKHLTYDRAAAGPDHAASLDSAGLAAYVRLAREAAAMLGPRRKVVEAIEAEVRQVSRKSVCVLRDLPAGHVLRRADLTVKRPGTGVPPARLEQVAGYRLARAVRANDLLQEADLTESAEESTEGGKS